jgi:UDP-N-acetylglucosamine:LPS N-acetylglucosamine transferase
VKQGASKLVEQRELSGDRLATEIHALAGDEALRRRMSDAARQMARPDAAGTKSADRI